MICEGPMRSDSQNSWKRTNRRVSSSSAEPSSNFSQVISYRSDNLVPTASNNHETIVTKVATNNYLVKKVYIDVGNSMDVLYHETFQKLGLWDDQLVLVWTPLVGFGGHVVYLERMITLDTTIRRYPFCQTESINYVMVRDESPYNMLLGHLTLNALWAIFFTYHLSFKFPTLAEIAEVTLDVRDAQECYLTTMQAISSVDPSFVC